MEQGPDPNAEIKKFLDMNPDDLNKQIQQSRAERELYGKVLKSPALPFARYTREHRRPIAACTGAVLIGSAALLLFWNDSQAPRNGAIAPPVVASSEPFVPLVPQTTHSLAPSTVTQSASPVTSAPETSAGIRSPQSTIAIRESFSTSKKNYLCEDLLFSAYKQRRICSQQEQDLFDVSRSQLESFSNSPEVYAAFPRGYEPVDRSAMGFVACSAYQQGASTDEVTQDIMQWYPVVEFSAMALAADSQDKICPQL